jgi:predicted metallopeptidase
VGQFKPVEEEDLAIWDLADKAAGAAQEVMVAVALAVTAADVDQVAMVAAVVAMVTGRAAVEVEMVAAVVTEAVDATAEAVVMEVEDPEWEEAACPDKVKVVLHNQKRKSGMQAYLIP